MSPDIVVRFIVGCFLIWVICVSLLIWLNIKQARDTDRSYDTDYTPRDSLATSRSPAREIASSAHAKLEIKAAA